MSNNRINKLKIAESIPPNNTEPKNMPKKANQSNNITNKYQVECIHNIFSGSFQKFYKKKMNKNKSSLFENHN